MGGYIGSRSVVLSTTAANVQDVTATDTTPEVTIINNTHEDTDGGREGKVIFKGQQSGGEESTLAEIQGSHDGTADDEKGDLIFKTNDGSDGSSPTEAMRIQSDQKIGVGVNDPDAVLDISGNDNKLGILRVVQRVSGAAAYGLDVGLDPTLGDPVFSRIENDVVSESFRIRRTNGALISSGGITLGTSGGAYALSNTLDDYETGTFTPVLGGSSAAGTQTGTNLGYYTKIGDLCYAEIRIQNITLSGATGAIKISGLPFAVNSTATYSGGVPIMMYKFAFTTDRRQGLYVSANQTYLLGMESRNGDTWQLWSVTNTNSLYMDFSFVYKT